MGLATDDIEQNSDGWKMKRLKSFYDMLSPRHGNVIIDYLKISIDSGEWTVIQQIISSGMFPKIRQLGIKFHLESNATLQELRNYASVIKSIEDGGMIRFSSKPQPLSLVHFDALGVKRYAVYEKAWYHAALIILSNGH